jgi:hypothetical protein
MRDEEDVRLNEHVPADRQLAALEGLLGTITPETLALPPAARDSLPPRPPGHPDNRELFAGYADPVFDTHAPAEVASSMVLRRIVQPERAMRMIMQHDSNADLPGLSEVMSMVTDELFTTEIPGDPYHAELQRTTQQVWADVLLTRADHEDVAPAVQARMTQELGEVASWLERNSGPDSETQAHRSMLLADIQRFVNREDASDAPIPSLDAPPGDPIGQPAPDYLRRETRRQELLKAWAPSLPACFR